MRNISHRDMVTPAGRIDRNALMIRAWQCVRREQALWRRAGLEAPPVRELLAHAMANCWGWSKAIQRGLAWGTLHDPRRVDAPMREAA